MAAPGSEDDLLVTLMANAAREQQKPLEESLLLLKSDYETFKTTQAKTTAQTTQKHIELDHRVETLKSDTDAGVVLLQDEEDRLQRSVEELRSDTEASAVLLQANVNEVAKGLLEEGEERKGETIKLQAGMNGLKGELATLELKSRDESESLRDDIELLAGKNKVVLEQHKSEISSLKESFNTLAAEHTADSDELKGIVDSLAEQHEIEAQKRKAGMESLDQRLVMLREDLETHLKENFDSLAGKINAEADEHKTEMGTLRGNVDTLAESVDSLAKNYEHHAQEHKTEAEVNKAEAKKLEAEVESLKDGLERLRRDIEARLQEALARALAETDKQTTRDIQDLTKAYTAIHTKLDDMDDRYVDAPEVKHEIDGAKEEIEEKMVVVPVINPVAQEIRIANWPPNPTVESIEESIRDDSLSSIPDTPHPQSFIESEPPKRRKKICFCL
ncbi:hypothetical protein EG327_000863 [Venturia inaequalis]|uniref:Uncharacterized protein n=1 Tax=Venturia inaequalis TaxID=5025 RepID=A0A8H3VPI4_VENIN|nr:hypothetical protein EG327_000863 [Venturia inaequalis]